MRAAPAPEHPPGDGSGSPPAPGRAGRGRAGPGGAGPSRAHPGHPDAGHTGPGRPGPGHPSPGHPGPGHPPTGADPAGARRDGADPGAAWVRVTVLAPHGRADLALPSDLPVAELEPMVFDLLGPPPGRLRPWRLARAAGGPLPPAATLDDLGLLDGELLRLVPVDAAPPPPVVDDPVDALAATAGMTWRGGGDQRPDHEAGAGGADPAAGAGAGRTAGAGVVAVLTAVAGALLLATTGGVWSVLAAVVAGAAAVLALVVCAVAARAPGAPAWSGPGVAVTAGVCAVPFAAAAGFTALAGPAAGDGVVAAITAGPAGVRLLLAALLGGAVAAAAQALVRRVVPGLVGVVVAAAPVVGVGVAHVRFGVPVPAAAAVCGALLLVTLPVLPRVALRLAGVPRPVVPADAGELVDADAAADVLPADELAARAVLARGLLHGLIGGTALPIGAAAVATATAPGWAAGTLAVLMVVVPALRARGFADPGPPRALRGSALVAAAGVAAVLATATPWGPVLAGGVLAGVALVAGLLSGRDGPGPSPVARRAVDIVDGLLVAVAVPVALGAAGAYEWVRALGRL